MCTTRDERRSISIRRQKECVESKLVISSRMLFKSYKHFDLLATDGRIDGGTHILHDPSVCTIITMRVH